MTQSYQLLSFRDKQINKSYLNLQQKIFVNSPIFLKSIQTIKVNYRNVLQKLSQKHKKNMFNRAIF